MLILLHSADMWHTDTDLGQRFHPFTEGVGGEDITLSVAGTTILKLEELHNAFMYQRKM
jgi:hypothetical protein